MVQLREVVRGGPRADDELLELHLVLEYVGLSLRDVLCAHRDLKPGNVLVGERDGRLRIYDLGLAESAVAPASEPAAPRQQPEGSPGYMSLEVLLCEKDGGAAAVDMWALGCIMAELVVGQPGKDLCQQLFSIVELLGIPDDVSLIRMGIAAAAPSKLRGKVPEEWLSPEGFDVLRGLLEYRLTAAAALRMPWFRSG